MDRSPSFERNRQGNEKPTWILHKNWEMHKFGESTNGIFHVIVMKTKRVEQYIVFEVTHTWLKLQVYLDVGSHVTYLALFYLSLKWGWKYLSFRVMITNLEHVYKVLSLMLDMCIHICTYINMFIIIMCQIWFLSYLIFYWKF